MITIQIENEANLKVKPGTTLIDVLHKIGRVQDRFYVAAYVNNKMRELTSRLTKSSQVRFIGINTLDGIRVYHRSASYILIKALYDLNPKVHIEILHSIGSGLYCEIKEIQNPSRLFLKRIEKRMQDYVRKDLPFKRREFLPNHAIEVFRKAGMIDKAKLLSYRKTKHASIYELAGYKNYFYGYLTPSTAYIRRFALEPYENGIILRLPSLHHPLGLPPAKKQHKFFNVLKEARRWRSILQIQNVGMLNDAIKHQNMAEVVLTAEAFHEKRIASIADQIAKRKQIRIVLASGPSASGKTTFMKRLALQLRILGYKPMTISMDDYFIDKSETPLDARGEHDFESPLALNIGQFKKNLSAIIRGREIQLPRYDFKTGTSSMSGNHMKAEPETIFLIEGIHALNPMFSDTLPQECIFKIYASALTEVPLDSHNRIPTTDTRILRRTIRDYQYRNYSATDTLLRWPSIREGETRHIFPYQEEADVFFNTALIYELAALKPLVEPAIKEVPESSPAFAEAHRLKKFLSYFLPIPLQAVPRHSILREFLGDSSFRY